MDISKLERAIDNKRLNIEELRFLHYFFDKIKNYKQGLEDMLKYAGDKETATVMVPGVSLRDHFLLSTSIREKINTPEGEE